MIKNVKTGKCYIGQTKNLDERWRRHKNGAKDCPVICNAIQKYGLDNFKFILILICFDSDLGEYEKHYIKYYNTLVPNGYNVSPGGEGGGNFIGKHHTEESKKLISEAATKRRQSENTKRLISESSKKMWLNPVIRDKLLINLKGSHKSNLKGSHKSKPTELTKQKISSGLKLFYTNNSINIQKHREAMAKAKGRVVRQYTLDGQLVNIYPSVSEASRQSGFVRSTIKNYIYTENKSNRTKYIWV